jgi:hypothetical protein
MATLEVDVTVAGKADAAALAGIFTGGTAELTIAATGSPAGP